MDECGKVFVVERECDNKAMRVTNFDKWLISVVITIVFVIFMSSFMFSFSNSIFSKVRAPTINSYGKPTSIGILIHALIVLVLIRLLMH